MNTIQRLTKNGLALFIAKTLAITFGFFYYIYTARYLGTEGFGILSFALAFTGIFSLLVDVGLSSLTTREISRNNSLANIYLGNIIVIKIFLSVFAFCLTMLTIIILDYSKEIILIVAIMFLSMIFTSFTQTFNSIFQAFEKMEYISIGYITNSFFMLAGAIIAINMNYGLLYFVLIYFVVNSIVMIYSMIVCTKSFVVPLIQIDLKFWKKLVAQSMPFWVTSVFIMIFFKVDMVMLSMMVDEVSVGIYAASYRLIDALAIMPSLVMSIVYPIFSKNYLNSKESLNLIFEKSQKFLILIAIPIGIGTTLLAEELILLIYGSQYVLSAIPLRILIWASVLSYVNSVPSTLLNSMNRQKILMKYTCIGAILNICLNYLLIPTMTYAGASIATVLTEFTIGILLVYHIHNTNKKMILSLNGTIYKAIISGLIMGFFVITFINYSIYYVIPGAALIYLILLILTKTFDKNEYKILKQILK